MKRAAVALLVVAVLVVLAAEARAAQLGIVGDGLKFIRRRLYPWLGMVAGLALVLLMAPVLPVWLYVSAWAFAIATAAGDVRRVLGSLGLVPRVKLSGDSSICDAAGPGWHRDSSGVYHFCGG